jgi:hypothetical protein
MKRTLTTVDEVVDALGGNYSVAILTGYGKTAVSNWRTRQRIPAENFLLICTTLERIGRRADPAVFGMRSA